MYDASIKTAVVINDPDDFLREFGDDPMHALTAGYERMGTENENIMVFLYTDERLGNVYQVTQFAPQGKNVNDIQIGCLNVAELAQPAHLSAGAPRLADVPSGFDAQRPGLAPGHVSQRAGGAHQGSIHPPAGLWRSAASDTGSLL